MSDALVRPMEERDIPAVQSMFIALHEYLYELGSLHKLNPEWPGDYLKMMLDSRLGRVFVLEADLGAVGFICVTIPYVNKKFIADGPKMTGFVSELFIEPSYRGKAFSRMLLSAAEGYFKALGIRHMQVEVLTGNETADSLYKGFGFAHTYSNLCKIIEE